MRKHSTKLDYERSNFDVSEDAEAHKNAGSRAHRHLALEKVQDVRVDHICIRCRHAMRKARIELCLSVLQQLRRKGAGVGEWHDLIVFTMHHQHGNSDFLEIVGEIGL